MLHSQKSQRQQEDKARYPQRRISKADKSIFIDMEWKES